MSQSPVTHNFAAYFWSVVSCSILHITLWKFVHSLRYTPSWCSEHQNLQFYFFIFIFGFFTLHHIYMPESNASCMSSNKFYIDPKKFMYILEYVTQMHANFWGNQSNGWMSACNFVEQRLIHLGHGVTISGQSWFLAELTVSPSQCEVNLSLKIFSGPSSVLVQWCLLMKSLDTRILATTKFVTSFLISRRQEISSPQSVECQPFTDHFKKRTFRYD